MFKKLFFVIMAFASLVALLYSGTMLSLEYFEIVGSEGLANIKLMLSAFVLGVFTNLLR